jgi:hypothetical protein
MEANERASEQLHFSSSSQTAFQRAPSKSWTRAAKRQDEVVLSKRLTYWPCFQTNCPARSLAPENILRGVLLTFLLSVSLILSFLLLNRLLLRLDAILILGEDQTAVLLEQEEEEEEAGQMWQPHGEGGGAPAHSLKGTRML